MKNTKINQQLEDVLMAFRQNVTTSILKEAKGSGFSLSHFEVIMYIARNGEVTMKDIAAWLNITPPSASVLVDVLVDKKLVTRVQSSKDRRTIHIALNKEAHKFMYSIHKKKMLMFKKMLSKISDDDKEILTRILNKCISN